MRSREMNLVLFIALLLGVLAVKAPTFFRWENVSDILVNSSYVVIAAVGMTLIIVAAGIDISVGSMLAVCCVVAGVTAKTGANMAVVTGATVLTGLLIGCVNGALTAWAGIPSIIVTLGMMSVLRGTMFWITKGYWITNLPDSFASLGLGTWAGIPKPVVLAAVTALAGGLFASSTPLGRAIYAVGGNPEAARLAGIPVRRVTFFVFALGGALVGLCTLAYATRFTVIQSNAGIGFELYVITAVVVGGTNIFGGRGSILGTVLAVLLLSIISTALVFLHISAYWEQTVQGLLILLAILVDVWRGGQATSRVAVGVNR